MDIRVDVDIDAVVKLTAEVLRQLPYAINSAITRTSKEAVQAGQNEAAARLQIRKNFLLRRIRILQYSRVSNLTAVIGVDSKVQGSPLILGFLEEGQSGEKKGSAGGGVAVPLTGSPARPSFPQTVPTSLRYKNLQFANRKGRRRTYVVPNVGVFERISSRRNRSPHRLEGRVLQSPGVDRNSESIEIYSFRPSVPLATHVHIRAAMLRVIGQRFAPIFTQEFIRELSARVAHLAGA
jgi:hypothetical protein